MTAGSTADLVKAVATGCLEIGSIGAFLCAVALWADALSVV